MESVGAVLKTVCMLRSFHLKWCKYEVKLNVQRRQIALHSHSCQKNALLSTHIGALTIQAPFSQVKTMLSRLPSSYPSTQENTHEVPSRASSLAVVTLSLHVKWPRLELKRTDVKLMDGHFSTKEHAKFEHKILPCFQYVGTLTDMLRSQSSMNAVLTNVRQKGCRKIEDASRYFMHTKLLFAQTGL